MSTQPVIEYLRKLEKQGQTHINVDEEARLILRGFYLRARNAGTGVKTNPARAAEKIVASEEVEPIGQLSTSGHTSVEKIQNLKQQVAQWAPIQNLDSLRKTMVFSVGNPEADVMLIGEAPGYDEERLAEPFVGKAGQKLDGILNAMGIRRQDVYISNIVKHRPFMPNQTTNNRKPTQAEI